MENTLIKIDGMSCQGCVKNITEVLKGLPGVSSVEVSLEAAQASFAKVSQLSLFKYLG